MNYEDKIKSKEARFFLSSFFSLICNSNILDITGPVIYFVSFPFPYFRSYSVEYTWNITSTSPDAHKPWCAPWLWGQHLAALPSLQAQALLLQPTSPKFHHSFIQLLLLISYFGNSSSHRCQRLRHGAWLSSSE